MYQKDSKLNQQGATQVKNKQWIDSVDLELIFMNSIAICIVLLAIVAADVFMA